MAEIPITAALVAEAGAWGWNGVGAGGALPAMLMGSLSPLRDDHDIADGAHGAVLFARDSAGVWRALMPAPGENLVGAFAAPHAGALILATMVQTEGPGQHWTLARSADGLRTASCLTIAFPAELNQPHWANEYVDLSDLDIRADGRGEVLGTANVERDGEPVSLHYAWRTRDGGETWTGPHRLRQIRAARAGLYDALDLAEPAPEALVQSLTDFAASR